MTRHDFRVKGMAFESKKKKIQNVHLGFVAFSYGIASFFFFKVINPKILKVMTILLNILQHLKKISEKLRSIFQSFQEKKTHKLHVFLFF